MLKFKKVSLVNNHIDRLKMNIVRHEHDISKCIEIDIQPNVKWNDLTTGGKKLYSAVRMLLNVAYNGM